MSTVTAQAKSVSQPLVRPGRQWLAPALFFGALWFVLCRHLGVEWSYNEQYNYGWFVPFFVAYLLWLRWTEGRAQSRPLRAGTAQRPSLRFIAAAAALLALVLLLPIRLFEIGNPGWRPLDWFHTCVVVGLTLLAIWAAGGRAWVTYFAFPILFFFVAVPWFNTIEEPIIQGLMRAAANIATEGLNAFGTPAQVEGSVIRINNGIVGVNEACSGVRSLQTSIMIGLLFGELYLLPVGRRVLLIVCTLALALIANCARSFFLVWVAAANGLPAMEKLHDLAGYAILLLVFAGAVLFARKLKSRNSRGENGISNSERESQPQSNVSHSAFRIPRSTFLLSPFSFLLFFSWLIAIEVAAESWYRAHERDLIPQPQWSVRWPTTAPRFHDIKLDERSRRLLRYDEGRGATWTEEPTLEPISTAADQSMSNRQGATAYLLYFFRWHPGQNNALLASVHRPDVCLPATGWEQTADHGVRYYRIDGSLAVPFRHFEFSHPAPGGGRQHAHAFYCLWEDRTKRGQDATTGDDALARGASEWTLAERWRVVAEGRRHLGQQAMELVLGNASKIDAHEAEERFTRLVANLIEPPKR